MKTIEIDGTRIKLRLWDTAGQERFHSLAPIYYRGATTAILCYDLTSKNSFAKIKRWVQELQENVDYEMIMVIVANKLDKEKFREVPMQEGRDYAQSIASGFFEVSAKTGQGVNDLFLYIGKRLLNYRRPNSEFNDEGLKVGVSPLSQHLGSPLEPNKGTGELSSPEYSIPSQSPPQQQSKRSGCCS
jgi:small GTP-binding protein